MDAQLGAYCGLSEAATYLQVSRRTVERLIDRGELQAYQRRLEPRHVLVKRDDLDQLKEVVPIDETDAA